MLDPRARPRSDALSGALSWEQVDLTQGLLNVSRLKNGVPSTHPLRGPELRGLRRLQRGSPASAYVFADRLRSAPDRRVRWHRRGARLPRASAYAVARLRLQARERRARHSSDPALPRPSEHPAHGSVYRPGARSIARPTTRVQLHSAAPITAVARPCRNRCPTRPVPTR